MKLALFLCSIALASINANAKWSDPLSLEECDSYPGYETQCAERYYLKEYVDMYNFLRMQIKHQLSGLEKKYEEEPCDDPSLIEDLTTLLTKREESWVEYIDHKCALESYGNTSRAGSSHFCPIESKINRRLVLGKDIKNGIGNEDCSTSGSIRLVTDSFIVDLSNNCEHGLYNCNEISYFGLRKSDSSTIKLKGKFYSPNIGEGNNNFQFIFENGAITYSVSIDGVLQVKNSSSGKTLVSESGSWERGDWH
jgi:hypothetical protein